MSELRKWANAFVAEPTPATTMVAPPRFSDLPDLPDDWLQDIGLSDDQMTSAIKQYKEGMADFDPSLAAAALVKACNDDLVGTVVSGIEGPGAVRVMWDSEEYDGSRYATPGELPAPYWRFQSEQAYQQWLRRHGLTDSTDLGED